MIVVRDNKVLLGQRKNVFMDGSWGLPGGHLETGEAMSEAALRELDEETGMSAGGLDFVALANIPSERRAHHVQMGFLAIEPLGEPELKEPHKCCEWKWFELASLPENIFDGHDRLIEAYLDESYFKDSAN